MGEDLDSRLSNLVQDIVGSPGFLPISEKRRIYERFRDHFGGDAIARAEKAEADAAAMRSALRDARDFAISVGQENPLDDGDVRQVEACEAALASDAGAALLERLKAADALRLAASGLLADWDRHVAGPDEPEVAALRETLAKVEASR